MSSRRGRGGTVETKNWKKMLLVGLKYGKTIRRRLFLNYDLFNGVSPSSRVCDCAYTPTRDREKAKKLMSCQDLTPAREGASFRVAKKIQAGKVGWGSRDSIPHRRLSLSQDLINIRHVCCGFCTFHCVCFLHIYRYVVCRVRGSRWRENERDRADIWMRVSTDGVKKRDWIISRVIWTFMSDGVWLFFIFYELETMRRWRFGPTIDH